MNTYTPILNEAIAKLIACSSSLDELLVREIEIIKQEAFDAGYENGASDVEKYANACIVFDGPPGPVSGRFVEVEDMFGHGMKLGKWRERDDELWSLDIQAMIDE